MSEGEPHRHFLRAGLLIAFIVMLLDQTTKFLVLRHFDGQAGLGEAITSFFNLVLTFNHGVTFGMFNGPHQNLANTVVFSLIALTIVTALIFWLRQARSLLVTSAIGLIIGGALGNLFDRLRLGGVVDFLDFYWRNWHYWAFNIADAAICIGVGLLVLDSLRRPSQG